MICPQCGKQLPEQTAFCDNCGTRQMGTSPVMNLQAAREVQNTPLKKKSLFRQWWFYVVLVVGLLIFFMVIGIIVPSGDDWSPVSIPVEAGVTSPSKEYSEAISSETAESSKPPLGKTDIDKWVSKQDFAALNAIAPELPKELQAYFCEQTSTLCMDDMAANQAPLLAHDREWVNEIQNRFAFVSLDFYDINTPIWDAMSYVGVIADDYPNYVSWVQLQEHIYNCVQLDGYIISRIKNAAYEDSLLNQEEEYLDEYLFESDFDGSNYVIVTSEKLQPGYFNRYVRHTGTSGYASEDGFEYDYETYEILTQEEVDTYLFERQKYDAYFEEKSIIDHQFTRLIEIVDRHIMAFPPALNETNFFGTYVCKTDELPPEYLNKITLSEDGTFILEYNYGEGTAEIKGTFKNIGVSTYLSPVMNEFLAEQFILENTNGKLVYHGPQAAYLDEGDIFVK